MRVFFALQPAREVVVHLVEELLEGLQLGLLFFHG